MITCNEHIYKPVTSIQFFNILFQLEVLQLLETYLYVLVLVVHLTARYGVHDTFNQYFKQLIINLKALIYNNIHSV